MNTEICFKHEVDDQIFPAKSVIFVTFFGKLLLYFLKKIENPSKLLLVIWFQFLKWGLNIGFLKCWFVDF